MKQTENEQLTLNLPKWNANRSKGNRKHLTVIFEIFVQRFLTDKFWLLNKNDSACLGPAKNETTLSIARVWRCILSTYIIVTKDIDVYVCVCAYKIGKHFSKWSEIPAGSSPAIVIHRKGLSTESKAYSLRSQQDPTIMETIRWWKIMNLFQRNASKLSLTIHFESQSTSSVGIYDVQ